MLPRDATQLLFGDRSRSPSHGAAAVMMVTVAVTPSHRHAVTRGHSWNTRMLWHLWRRLSTSCGTPCLRCHKCWEVDTSCLDRFEGIFLCLPPRQVSAKRWTCSLLASMTVRPNACGIHLPLLLVPLVDQQSLSKRNACMDRPWQHKREAQLSVVAQMLVRARHLSRHRFLKHGICHPHSQEDCREVLPLSQQQQLPQAPPLR